MPEMRHAHELNIIRSKIAFPRNGHFRQTHFPVRSSPFGRWTRGVSDGLDVKDYEFDQISTRHSRGEFVAEVLLRIYLLAL